MARSFSELAEAYTRAQGARASWFVAARHVPDALAKLGIVGPADRLVVCADDFEQAFRTGFPGERLRFIGEPSAAAFLAASGAGEGRAADADAAAGSESDAPSLPVISSFSDASGEAGTVGRAREGRGSGAPVAHHASYAHAAGASAEHLFWFVNAIGCRGLRVPDLRELARAAQGAGAILIVDDTVPSCFGCAPLELGAHIVLEALDRVAAGAMATRTVALAVARSVTGRGRRQRTDPVAEDAYLVLAQRLGQGAAPAPEIPLEDLAALDRGLASLSARMQAHMDNARAIAEYLACHPRVPSVSYPGLKSHPDHAVAANVLRHGFGPAVDFELPAPVTAASLIAVCDPAFRAAPAGGPCTRLSARDGAEARFIRLFAGVDDPLDIVDSLDQALRMFCNPPQP